MRRMWQAHLSAVKSIVPCGALVFSLGQDGSIRGWSPAAPTPQHLLAWHVSGVAGLMNAGCVSARIPDHARLQHTLRILTFGALSKLHQMPCILDHRIG